MSRTTIQGSCGGRRGGGQPVGAAVGVQGFVDSTNWFETAAGVFLPGAGAGFFCAVAVHILSAPAASTFLMQSGISLLDGFVLRNQAGGLTFSVASGAPATISSPSSPVAAGDIGEVLTVACILDATAGLVRLYRTGVQVGAGTAIVGYTAPAGAQKTSLGARPAGTSSTPWARIVGALYGTGIPDAAAILAHYNACKAANTMESMGGAGVVNVNRWQAKDNIPNAATWVDDIGGMVLTKTGTLSSVIFNPVWE